MKVGVAIKGAKHILIQGGLYLAKSPGSTINVVSYTHAGTLEQQRNQHHGSICVLVLIVSILITIFLALWLK